MPEKEKPKPKLDQLRTTISVSSKLLVLFWKMDRFLLIENLIAVIIPAVIPFVTAYIFKLIIDIIAANFSGKPTNYNELFFLFGLFFAMQYLNRMAMSFENYATKIFYIKFPIVIDQLMLNKVANLDLYYFEDSSFRDLLQKARESYNFHPQQLVYQLLFFIQSVVQVLIALVALWRLNFFLVILISIVSIPDLVNQIYFSKFSWSIYNKNTPLRKKYSYLLNLVLDRKNMKELKIFQTAPTFFSEIEATRDEFYNENKKIASKQFGTNTIFNLLDTVVLLGIIIYMVFQALARKITLGDISYYQSVVSNFSNGIGGMFSTLGRVFDESQYITSIFEVLALPEIITQPKDAIKIDFDKTPVIEFKNVTFSYPGNTKPILKDFSLIISPGEKIALVGENGAGKSTIIKLLARFYDVDKGEILIDGINIKLLDLVSWQKTLGILFQDFIQYEYPAEDNIFFGRIWEKQNLDAIIDASRSAGAHDMIKKFDGEYKQMLGRTFENGLELSGGQWQKIALARAFFRNAPVLVLDEPTAAIDAKAESEIFSRVERLSKDKTVIIISHRFSTVRNADKIYVVENGKIVESGDHKSLMKLDGQYATLFNLQAKGYQ